MKHIIYKICDASAWREARAHGLYAGSEHDRRAGFIHLSTAAQLAATLAKHYAGRRDLVLLAVDGRALGSGLRCEPARNGELFPHLYGPLPTGAVLREHALPLGCDGRHVIPDLAP